MTALGLAARFAHLAAALGLVGVLGAMLLAGPSDRPTALSWLRRMAGLARWLIALALVSGAAVLAHQAAVVTGRPAAALEPAVWARLLGESQLGTVWLVRGALLAALGVFLALVPRRPDGSAADFFAWRAEAGAIAAVALAAIAWAGHAAAVEPLGPVALVSDAVHAAAAGAWLGALLPLALLLRAASREAGADARPYAVLAVRRFSRLAVAAMTALAVSGLWNAWVQVGGVPALIGTRYGWLLLIKLGLLVPIAALAVANRRRLPALSGDGDTVGRPAMRAIARFLGGELGLALGIAGVTAALALTVPAVHDTPRWPLAYRLSYAAVADVPGITARLFIGSQVAFLGLLVAVVGSLLRRWQAPLVIGGAIAIGFGLWIALPPLAVDAYPTTYERSPVAYQAGSVSRGLELYAAHCATCHGPAGTGDGPGGYDLARRPADLTAPHTGQHTAGDLYWWITHGIPGTGMPSFAPALSDDESWDLINFLRALAAGQSARALTPKVEPERPWLVAPDFTFSIGPGPARTLRDYRGRSMVLLVLFTLPDSATRMAELARAYPALELAGAEVVAVPVSGERGIIRRLGARPPILFPVATEGEAEIVPAYGLFSRAPAFRGSLLTARPPRHTEFLIDRQGYIRARWLGAEPGPGWRDLPLLLGEIRSLDREPPVDLPAEHVH